MSFSKSLKGFRILDFTRLIPGPFGTHLLVEMGADVIKIEDMGKGDYLNGLPPEIVSGVSGLFAALNTGKKRLKLNFSSHDGRLIVKKLVKTAHAVVESFRPGAMDVWGIGYQALRKTNPKLVYASMTAFGSKGVDSQQAGHDINFLAASGFLDHFPGGVRSYQFGDFIGGGLWGALKILDALHASKRERKGRFLDLNVTDALVALRRHELFAETAPDLRMITGKLARYQVYHSHDGRAVALGAFEDKFWDAFCVAIKQPAWRGLTLDDTVNRQQITALTKLFSSQCATYWHQFSIEHDICLTVSATKDDLMASERLRAVSFKCGDEKTTVYESSALTKKSQLHLSRPGEDTRSVLKQAGYTAAQIKKFYQDEVVA